MTLTILNFLFLFGFLTQIYADEPVRTTSTTVQSTTDPCVHGYMIDGTCQCNNHYEGVHCDKVICENGIVSKTNYNGDQQCDCYLSYYGTKCQYQCRHGVWVYSSRFGLDSGYCQCIRGWAGNSCDHTTSYSNGYQSYTASILFLCLAAFMVIGCVLCLVNKRRRQRLAREQRRFASNSPIRTNDQRQYGSFYEGHDNQAANIENYESAVHPPPLPKYEDALKLPVFVTPTSQCTTLPNAPPDGLQPPPYAELTISTIPNSQDSQHQNLAMPHQVEDASNIIAADEEVPNQTNVSRDNHAVI